MSCIFSCVTYIFSFSTVTWMSQFSKISIINGKIVSPSLYSVYKVIVFVLPGNFLILFIIALSTYGIPFEPSLR